VGCSSDNDTVDCEFVQPIELEGPYTGNATFTFVDDANNRAVVSKQIEIYGVGTETSANFWTVHSIDCTPRLIDREVASYDPPYQSCRVVLRTPRSDITPLSIATTEDWETECTGNNSYIRDMYVSNYFVGKKDPYLVYVLNSEDYNVDNLTINCPLVVRSLKTNATGKYAIPGSQKINVTTSFEFYNNPAGEAYKNLDSKIERALNNGFTSWEWLEELSKILDYAKSICTIISAADNLMNSIFTLAISLGWTGGGIVQSAPAAGPGAPAVRAAGQAVQNTAQTFCNIQVKYEGIYGSIREPLMTICGITTCSSVGSDSIDWSWLGGGVPWCKGSGFNIENWGIPALKQEGLGGNNLDIKNSLVLSTACLCLPGIIYNLEKLRQIYCFEAVCYHDMVKEQGYPVSFCSGQYNYMWCTFVIHEVFAGAPFVGLFNRMMDMVVSTISNPLIGVGVVFGTICETTCPAIGGEGISGTSMYFACASYKIFAAVMEAVSIGFAMAQSGSEFWAPTQAGYCDRAQDIAKKYKGDEE